MPRPVSRKTPARSAVGYVNAAAAGAPDAAAQRDAIAAGCRARGWKLMGVHVESADENGGAVLDRPAWLAALAAVGQAKGVLVIERLSCLGRSALACIGAGDRLAKAGADLVALSEKIDTTVSGGRCLLTTLALLADLERKRLQRTLTFGFDVADDLERIVISPAEQAAIHRMVKLRFEGWDGPRIARQLNEEGVPAKGGRRWTGPAVQETLDRLATSRWIFD